MGGSSDFRRLHYFLGHFHFLKMHLVQNQSNFCGEWFHGLFSSHCGRKEHMVFDGQDVREDEVNGLLRCMKMKCEFKHIKSVGNEFMDSLVKEVIGKPNLNTEMRFNILRCDMFLYQCSSLILCRAG